MTTHVTVHIYDLGPVCVDLNALGRAVGTGAFHAGVEVYGAEYSFSPGGVCHFPPRGCPHHIYREPIQMGRTRMSKRDVDNLIGKLVREWPGIRYDILERNCCHFSNELCNRLGVGSLPYWVTSLADAGADLRNFPKAVQDLAISGMEAILELWQAPQQVADEIRQRRPRKITAKDRVYPEGHPLKAVEIRDARTPGEKRFGEFSVGERIEVFSNSRQMWCRGQLKHIQNKNPVEKLATVAFVFPDGGIDEIMYKDLPLGSKEMRKARHGGC